MALVLRHRLRDERGQTTVEWLLLMGSAFITAYFILTGPAAEFSRKAIYTVRGGLANVIQNGDLKPGQLVGPNDKGHPSSAQRLVPIH